MVAHWVPGDKSIKNAKINLGVQNLFWHKKGTINPQKTADRILFHVPVLAFLDQLE